MFKSILVAVLFVMSVNAYADSDKYDDTEKALVQALAIATVVDLGQTLDISHKCNAGQNYYERNPFMKDCPSKSDVYRHFIGSAIITYTVADYLSNRNRKLFLSGLLLLEIGMVANNYSIGLGVRF